MRFTIPPGAKLRQPYQTLFGPAVSCNGIVYQPDVPSLALALHRQLCARRPDQVGVDEALYDNQWRNWRRYRPAFRAYARKCEPLVRYDGSYYEELRHYADAHPKRSLRIRAHREAQLLGTDHVWHRLERGRNVVKFKVEIGKGGRQGKVPRTIVDIGVAGSLVGFRLAEEWKKAMATTPFRHLDMEAHFIPSATHRNLKCAFDILRNPTKRLTFIVFSDDAALAIRSPDGSVQYVDVDISSCDKSHGKGLFKLLEEAAPASLREDLKHLIQQLKAPLLIRNPHVRAEKIRITPTEPTLYSGSVLTTLINNVAVFLIALACAELRVVDPRGVVAAAESVGYIVTADARASFEEVQFLKHSPALDVHGEWHPVLNLGVMLRASGVVYGELPGTRADGWRKRAVRQQAALLQCTWPNTHFPLIDSMRARYRETTPQHQACAQRQRKWTEDGWPELQFSDAAILRRYGWVTPPPDLEYFFHHAAPFTIHSGPSLHHALRTDYGMGNYQLTPLARHAEWRTRT